LFARKKQIDKVSGSLIIMSMYVGHEFLTDRCTYVYFQLFDYAAGRLIGEVRYEGEEGYLAEIKYFIVHDLYKLARPVLVSLSFEGSPFRLHYEALIQIIKNNRFAKDPLEDYSIASGSDSIRPATPPPIYEFDDADM
jgi:hypothetical protein